MSTQYPAVGKRDQVAAFYEQAEAYREQVATFRERAAARLELAAVRSREQAAAFREQAAARSRERAATLREQAAARREQAAARREQAAARREARQTERESSVDRAADERDRVTDHRDRAADERDRAADARDRVADGRAQVLTKPRYPSPAEGPADGVAVANRFSMVRVGSAGEMAADQGWASLTDGELRVVAAVARGMSNRSIAEELHVSRHTVDAHLKHVYLKLDIHTRVQLTVLALQQDTSLLTAHRDDRV